MDNQEKKGFPGKFFHNKTGLKAWGELFCTAYLLLMFGVYPFYMEQGYVDIGEAKYRFFIYCSLAALAILGTIGACRYAKVLGQRIKRCEPYLFCWENVTATDLFVLLYATELFISYALSGYREEALWGTEGWHIGLVPLLTLCGLYFLISRFFDGRALVWYVSVAASGTVFVLGILDRFSVHLIPLKIRQPAFISTLGNINWFCGYLTVLAPIGIYIFLFSEKNAESGGSGSSFGRRGKKWFAACYVVIAFMAGFCQGSSSIFVFFAALFYILLWMAVEKRAWFANWCLLAGLWGFAAQLVRAMRILMPGRYNYETDNWCAYLTDSNITLLMGAAAFLCFAWMKKREAAGEKRAAGEAEYASIIKTVRRVMAVTLAAGIFLWLGLICFFTLRGNANQFFDGAFYFDEHWGNGRGAALKAGAEMYVQMPFGKKVIGTGPDCFSAYAYSLPKTAGSLRESFGADRLTNAHNELLTGLVNTGIAGVILYLGIFGSFILRHAKKGTFFSRMAIVCIFCYLAHNMVSFAQVLNVPFVFWVMAMGERQKRE